MRSWNFQTSIPRRLLDWNTRCGPTTSGWSSKASVSGRGPRPPQPSRQLRLLIEHRQIDLLLRESNGVAQVCTFEVRLIEIGAGEVGLAQIRILKRSLRQIGFAEIRLPQIRLDQAGLDQACPPETRSS